MLKLKMPDYVDDTANLKELSVKRTYTGSDTPSGGHETPINFVLKSEVKLGAYAHAMSCELNLGTSGSVHGAGSGGTSILIPPNGTLQRGAIYAHVFEVGAQASSSWGSAGPVGFCKFEQWGTKAYFDANAFFFHITGLDEGQTEMYSVGTSSPACTQTLRCKMPDGSTRYLMFCDAAVN